MKTDISQLIKNTEEVHVRLSADGASAVIGSTSRCDWDVFTCTLSDIESTTILLDRPIKSSAPYEFTCNKFDISPDGRYVAFTQTHEAMGGHYSSDGMDCFIYDRERQEYLPQFVSQELHHKTSFGHGVDGRRGYDWLEIRFLDDNRLATVTVTGEVFIWAVRQQQLLMAWTAAALLAHSAAFTHQFGRYAISEAVPDDVRTQNIGKHKVSSAHSRYPDEKYRRGCFLRLWDNHSGEVIREVEGDKAVHGLMFSHDDRLLAGMVDSVVHVWDVESGAIIQMLPEGYSLVGFTSDDRHIIISDDHGVVLWQIDSLSIQPFAYTIEGMLVDCMYLGHDRVALVEQQDAGWFLHQFVLEPAPEG